MIIFDYVDEYIDVKNFKSSSTKRLYRLALNRFKSFLLDNELELKFEEAYFTNLINTFENSMLKKYSKSSVTSFIKVIINYFNYLETEGYIEGFTNCVATIDDNNVQMEDIISYEEFNKIIDYLHMNEDYINEFLINIAFYTGIKAKFLCKIKYTDFVIDSSGEFYFINKIMKISPFKMQLPQAVKELFVFLSKDNEESGRNKIYIFINKKGNVYTERYVRSVFQNVCIGAKVKPYTTSSFRHSAVYYYIKQNGCDKDKLSVVFNWTKDNYDRMYKNLFDGESKNNIK